MNIMNIVSQVAPLLGNAGNPGVTGGAAGGGILGDIFEVLGVQNPEALAEAGGGPGSIINALLQSVGIDSEVAQVVGIVTDAATGNVPGAVSQGGELIGGQMLGEDHPATDLLSLTQFIKV